MKLSSRIRDGQTSNVRSGPFAFSHPGEALAAWLPFRRALCKKEREGGGRGQKQAGGRDSFLRMRIERWTHGMAGMALGAVAACLGIAIARNGDVPLPVTLGLCTVLVAGLSLAGRAGRRPSLFKALPIRMRVPMRPGPDEEDSRGADLLGHEMKNYLCTLKGNARLLRQRVPSDDQAILDRIDRVVEKLESFTRGLAGAGDAATGLGPLSPVRPAQAALACARTHFHKRMDAFRFSEDSEAPPLFCDAGRFEQVLLNLYANSLEAGAGRIETVVSGVGGRLIVRIEDDGHGCAREDLERIFEPFYTTKPGPARRGLGMFIVRSIVENHGGRIGVATKNGGAEGRTGLVFTLDFPAQDRGSPAHNETGRARYAVRPAPLSMAKAPADESWLLAPHALHAAPRAALHAAPHAPVP